MIVQSDEVATTRDPSAGTVASAPTVDVRLVAHTKPTEIAMVAARGVRNIPPW
jgi:hypothetical protein